MHSYLFYLTYIICIISISTIIDHVTGRAGKLACRVLQFLHLMYLSTSSNSCTSTQCTKRIYEVKAFLIIPKITFLHILPDKGMVVCKSFTNSRFGYERSLTLLLRGGGTLCPPCSFSHFILIGGV